MKKSGSERIFFVSFADSSLKPSLERIKNQANLFYCFKKIYIYTEKTLPRYAKKRVNKIIQFTGSRRGYGYWSWKPSIIQAVLNKMREGDVLLYADAGCHLNPRGEERFMQYVDCAKKYDIWVTQLDDSLNELNWTKSDTIDFFKKRLTDENLLKTGQIQATIMIVVKNAYTCRIVSEWNELMDIKNIHLFDDSPSIQKNVNSFVENRHDQSMFSLLLKCNHYYADSARHCYSETEGGWAILEETEPILAKRDKQQVVKQTVLQSLKRRVKMLIRRMK